MASSPTLLPLALLSFLLISSTAAQLPARFTVADLVTDSFFNSIIDQASWDCPGKRFFTRAAFLQALSAFPDFANTGTVDDSKREIAAFFAHVTYTTGHMCYIEEVNGASKDYCDETNTTYPCVPGKSYHGRGPLPIMWNYNYGPVGQAVGFDGLGAPETLARDVVVSFRAALTCWMRNCHVTITSGRGFGASIRVIGRGQECDGKNPAAVAARVQYYTDYCWRFGVDPGSNVSC